MNFNTGITTTTTTLVMDGFNHIDTTSGLVPVLSACGTSPTIVGNDWAGSIVSGTGAGNCTLTFFHSYVSAPICHINQQSSSGGVVPPVTSLTNIGFTFTAGASLTYKYICFGQPGG